MCQDGTKPHGEGNACVSCPIGKAGRSGLCTDCPTAQAPTEGAVACENCAAGKQKAPKLSLCTHCEPGYEPLPNSDGCELCASGYRSSPEETNGMCLACGRGEQPTDDRFVVRLSGATRCSECSVGQYSEYDAALQVSHKCLRCPEGSSTKNSSSSDASDCLCAAYRYDSVRLGIIWGHPGGFNDSLTRKVMAASKRDIEASLRCVGCSDEGSFMTCAVDERGVIGDDPIVAAGFAELRLQLRGAEFDAQGDGDSDSSARYFNSSARHFFACPFGEAACPRVSLGQNATGCSEAFHGLLCSECTDGFAQTGRGCVKCDSGEMSKLLVGILLAVIVGGLLAWKVVNRARSSFGDVV